MKRKEKEMSQTKGEGDNIFDISNYDKTNFVCVKFPDSSLYYGEVAYFDSNLEIVNKKNSFTKFFLKK